MPKGVSSDIIKRSSGSAAYVGAVNQDDSRLVREHSVRESGGSARDDTSSRRLGFAMRALERASVVVLYQNLDLVYQWAMNLPEEFPERDIVGRRDSDIMPSLAAERLESVKRSVIETREGKRFELPVNFHGELQWFDISVDPDISANGEVIGIFATSVEITEQKRREVQLKNLLREVSHRSKNLLAIILSLASQTARSSKTLSGFVSAFSGRLQAIARAQDIVTDRDWRGALMSELIARQIALFRGDRPLPVEVKGHDQVISPSAALYVGLALHELAAIAVRRGQLVAAEGGITIECVIENGEDGRRALAVTWIQACNGTTDAEAETIEPLTRAFLENVVPLAVDGTGKIETGEGSSLRYTLRIDSVHLS